MSVYKINIEKSTIKNNLYRKILYTNSKQQLVLMSLKPNETIPLEKHLKTSQFIRVENGNGIAQISDKKYILKYGSVLIIPPNTYHFIKNTSETEDLKLYTIYSPPVH
jgi:mannose-6-phosphate isomerase-like protein (cupin superfamily)